MATITVGQAQFLGNAHGNAPILRGGAEQPNIKETASQTYGQGAPVYKDSNGTIAVATAGSNLIAQICGFAMKAASGVTGTAAPYRVLQDGDLILCNLKGTSTTTTAATLIGDLCNFDISSGNLVANPDSAVDTNVAGTIVGIYTSDYGYNGTGETIGDTNGRIIVQIFATKGLQG
jgi:hypothetical protein